MTKDVALESLNQRLSYIVGENMANQLKNDGIELEADALVLAVKDVMAGNPSRLTDDVKRSTVEEIQKISQEQQAAANAEKSAKNSEEGVAFLAENSQKAGVTTTDSGLQYKVVTKGDGAKPTAEDTVKVHYKGTLIDGTVFDSSYDVVIPSDLAYGPMGSGQAIGPDAVLKFDVELLGIE